jgi:hypothetical protein
VPKDVYFSALGDWLAGRSNCSSMGKCGGSEAGTVSPAAGAVHRMFVWIFSVDATAACAEFCRLRSRTAPVLSVAWRGAAGQLLRDQAAEVPLIGAS